jgi:hypothetical protein
MICVECKELILAEMVGAYVAHNSCVSQKKDARISELTSSIAALEAENFRLQRELTDRVWDVGGLKDQNADLRRRLEEAEKGRQERIERVSMALKDRDEQWARATIAEEENRRLMEAMDRLYNYNEAVRHAVIDVYGIHHGPKKFPDKAPGKPEGMGELETIWNEEISKLPPFGGPSSFSKDGIRYVLRSLYSLFRNEVEIRKKSTPEATKATVIFPEPMPGTNRGLFEAALLKFLSKWYLLDWIEASYKFNGNLFRIESGREGDRG